LISLSLGHFIFGYATGLVVLIFLIWLTRGVFRARRDCRQKRRAIQCAHCGVLYEDASTEPLPACPQCGQPNERFSPPLV